MMLVQDCKRDCPSYYKESDYKFYLAMVLLPLQKAQALDPTDDAFNE